MEEGAVLANKLPLVKEDHIFLSKEGVPLLVFLKGGVFRPWKVEQKDKLKKQVTYALDSLQKAYPAHPPAKHGRNEVEDKREEYEAKGVPYGVYYLAFWRAVGHVADNPTLSKDILLGAQRFNAVIQFLKDITPLAQSISILFEIIDEPAYTQYRASYEEWLKTENSALSTIHTSGRACFMGTAILRNFTVKPHKDSRDPRDGWVGMTCWGDFEGGHLVIPELG
ncbi:MAG: hypothetical protein M1816_000791, partial [Peltula sp. TS41687]